MSAAAFALFSLVVAWNYFVHNGPWHSEEVRSADAVVIDVDRGRRSDGATVEFADATGRRVVAETRVRENAVDAGERLRVEYTAGSRPLVRVPGAWRPAYQVFGAYAAAMLLLCLVWTAIHLVRGRRTGSAQPDSPAQSPRGGASSAT